MRFLIVVALGACGTSRPDSTADPDAAVSTATCESLAADIQDRLARTAGSCVTDDDCTAIGGQLGTVHSCDCTPYILNCGGEGIAKNSPELAPLQADLADFEMRGCQIEPYGTLCDCAPSTITCENGHCATAGQSCLGP